MARSREKFEVKNEMQDGGKIRPDDSYKQNGGKSSKTQRQEILSDVNEIGFDDEYEDIDEVDVYEDIEQETYEGEKEVYEDNRNDIQDEYDTVNLQVESELEQYWDDDITQEDLIQYFTNKISEIYGEKLKKCNIVIDSFVEGFFQYNVPEVIVDKSEAIETYRKLVQATNETIADISERMAKRKNEKTVANKENKLQTLSEQELQRIMTGYQNVSRGGEYRTDVSKQIEETGAILHSVNGKPIREEKTGLRLKSVNGRDILSSAIEATEETTRVSTINEQVNGIRSIQRDRTQQQNRNNNGIDR